MSLLAITARGQLTFRKKVLKHLAFNLETRLKSIFCRTDGLLCGRRALVAP